MFENCRLYPWKINQKRGSAAIYRLLEFIPRRLGLTNEFKDLGIILVVIFEGINSVVFQQPNQLFTLGESVSAFALP